MVVIYGVLQFYEGGTNKLTLAKEITEKIIPFSLYLIRSHKNTNFTNHNQITDYIIVFIYLLLLHWT